MHERRCQQNDYLAVVLLILVLYCVENIYYVFYKYKRHIYVFILFCNSRILLLFRSGRVLKCCHALNVSPRAVFRAEKLKTDSKKNSKNTYPPFLTIKNTMKNKTKRMQTKEKKKPKFYPGHTLPFIRAMDRWIIPLTFSFMIATLVAYAMEIEGAAKFITLSYPLNGNMFAKGSNDMYFVFFSFFVLLL